MLILQVSRATFCLQYRLIIQFFMVAALVATNVFNVFTMNLGTTGLPLGQVRSVDADAIYRTMHAIDTMLFATAFCHAQHAVDKANNQPIRLSLCPPAGRLFPRLTARVHADGSGIVRWQRRAAVPQPGVHALQAHADVVMNCHTVEYRVGQRGVSVCATVGVRCGQSVRFTI